MFQSRFRKNQKGCPCKTRRDFCNALCKCLMTSKKCQNLCKRIRFYFSTMYYSISRGMDLFNYAVQKTEKIPQTYVLRTSISSAFTAFSDKLTIVCSFDSLILLDQREGEEREICKLQEAMRPFITTRTLSVFPRC